jgi:hypothetical protein
MTFRIINSKGFHISFPNGWTISVQFGIGNYCGKYPYDQRDYDAPSKSRTWESPDAEVAIWADGRDMHDPEGWQSPLAVAELIALLASDPAPYYFGA